MMVTVTVAVVMVVVVLRNTNLTNYDGSEQSLNLTNLIVSMDATMVQDW